MLSVSIQSGVDYENAVGENSEGVHIGSRGRPGGRSARWEEAVFRGGVARGEGGFGLGVARLDSARRRASNRRLPNERERETGALARWWLLKAAYTNINLLLIIGIILYPPPTREGCYTGPNNNPCSFIKLIFIKPK